MKNFIGRLSDASISATESAEIRDGLGDDVIVQFENYSSSVDFVYRDVEEASRSNMGSLKIHLQMTVTNSAVLSPSPFLYENFSDYKRTKYESLKKERLALFLLNFLREL